MKRESIIRNTVLTTVLVVGLSVAASASAVTWRGWNTHSKGYPNTVALEQFAKTITEKTDIQAKVYNNGVLGSQTDAIQQVITGALQFGNFNLSPMGQYVKQVNIVSLPYLFGSIQQMYKVMNGSIGDKLADAMADQGLIVLSWFGSGARSFYNSQHPIHKPSDLKGMKIRVQRNDLYVSMVEALGANASPIPTHQVYQALASGVVDGAENNYPTYKEFNHYKVAPYYTEDRHFIVPECLCVSKKAWNQLSDKTQKVVRKAAIQAAQLQHKLWAKDAKKAKAFVAAHGAHIVPNKDVDIKAFQKAMKPVYEKFFKKHPKQRAMVKKIRSMQ